MTYNFNSLCICIWSPPWTEAFFRTADTCNIQTPQEQLTWILFQYREKMANTMLLLKLFNPEILFLKKCGCPPLDSPTMGYLFFPFVHINEIFLIFLSAFKADWTLFCVNPSCFLPFLLVQSQSASSFQSSAGHNCIHGVVPPAPSLHSWSACCGLQSS